MSSYYELISQHCINVIKFCSSIPKQEQVDRTTNRFCAGNDSCNGDSGGSLLVEAFYEDIYKYVQFCVVSNRSRICYLLNNIIVINIKATQSPQIFRYRCRDIGKKSATLLLSMSMFCLVFIIIKMVKIFLSWQLFVALINFDRFPFIV